MSYALESFELSIKDAEYLFSLSASGVGPEQSDILKRSALVMTMTSWETYVEDRIQEAIIEKIALLKGSFIEVFMMKSLGIQINQLHNPSSSKTKQLFEQYLGVDIQLGWVFDGLQPQSAASTLNALLDKRGQAVHRARNGANQTAHLITKSEAEKAINFIKKLVLSSDKYLEKQLCPHN